MTTSIHTPLESSIDTLIEIDEKEAALKEQLQQLARQKVEAKKTGGERAKDDLLRKIPETRVALLGLLRTAQSLDVSLESEYPTTLRRIVKDAGASGIALALVQEVLPDNEKLQAARDQLGQNGTDEIIERRAKEHLKEGKGRGLFFVWNDKAAAPVRVNESPIEGDIGDTETQDSGAEQQPEPTPQAAAKPAAMKPAHKK